MATVVSMSASARLASANAGRTQGMRAGRISSLANESTLVKLPRWLSGMHRRGFHRSTVTEHPRDRQPFVGGYP
jgi:hypothetical protein